MKNYKKAGTLGEIIYSMETNTKITDQRIFDKFAAILEEKYSIGEFDIVELLCLGGTYHFVHGDYKKSQTCFYDALSELKHQLTKDSNIDFGTEAKIYQSKFNISLAHLMMKVRLCTCRNINIRKIYLTLLWKKQNHSQL